MLSIMVTVLSNIFRYSSKTCPYHKHSSLNIIINSIKNANTPNVLSVS